MTAEVGVLNSLAVALAADSAVTIGKEADKIYTSANKIFQLSCSAPVGVMIYGNANLVGLPWETVIKTYRQQLGDQRFDTVAGYAENLIDYLENGSHGMFPKQQQDFHAYMVVYSFFDELKEDFWASVRNEILAGNDVDNDDVMNQLLDDQVRKYSEYVLGCDLLPGFTKKDIAAVRKAHHAEINAPIEAVFRPDIPAKTKAALKKLAAEVLCRKVPTALTSGVVIAGFGEKEFMPSLVTYDIEEMALGRLRHVKDRSVVQIDADTRALVVPFAQKEMVYSFMEGVDRQLLDFMQCSARDLFHGVLDEVHKLVQRADPKIGEGLKTILEAKEPELLKDLFDGWRQQRASYWKPVLQITGSLPKDELAAMAEALVNLTKFRRRVTTERETVGGPIDVAVITKGDGFVWIRRKHYFAPEYNPRVIARYAKGG